MGRLILFPGVDLDPPGRPELVDELSDMMLKEVLSVFVEHHQEIGSMAWWYHSIRHYFWRQEITLIDRDFRRHDIMRWGEYWRARALEAISHRY